MRPRFLDRLTPPHLATLVIATAVGPMAMNVFLPSLPGIARYYDADYAVAQLLVSFYLAATAFLQLFIGPASDRYGRRPVMLTGMAVFLTATVLSLYAPTIEALLICRVFQAFSAAGMVLSRAIVRDMVGIEDAASRIGYITMGMTIVPMIGPAIGGLLDEYYGWHATFVMILICGVAATVIIYLDLGETNAARSSSLAAQFAGYPQLFRSRRFWGYTLTAAFTSGSFFAFLGGGPYVATELLSLSPSAYGLYFATVSIGYMAGNFMSGRFSRAIGLSHMMLYGNLAAGGGIAVAVLLFAMGLQHPMTLFGPMVLVGVGNGMTLPNANAGIVSVRPHLAGSASGLGGALQIGGGAALSVLAGVLLGPATGPYPLLWLMLTSSVAAIATTLYVMRIDRIEGRLKG